MKYIVEKWYCPGCLQKLYLDQQTYYQVGDISICQRCGIIQDVGSAAFTYAVLPFLPVTSTIIAYEIYCNLEANKFVTDYFPVQLSIN